MTQLFKQTLGLSALLMVACEDGTSAQLHVQDVNAVDCADPGAALLTPRVMNLWPPNHKFHSVGIADCVGVYDACDPAVRAEFIWASSDEPVDSKGDGHHQPDILFDDCNQVQLRSERQGPKDGRVYKLGVRMVDAAGKVSLGECTVIVDHDQRGVVGADSGESYRITPDGTNGLPLCNGMPGQELPDSAVPPPPVVDSGAPVVDAGSPQVIGF